MPEYGDIMGLFSEELRILDRNTVQYMIEKMQDTLKTQDEILSIQDDILNIQDNILDTQDDILSIQDNILKAQKDVLKTQQNSVHLLEFEILLKEKYSHLYTLNQKLEELRQTLAKLE